MATHSSILAERIPWTEEPGRLQSTGSQRVRHDCEHAHTSLQKKGVDPWTTACHLTPGPITWGRVPEISAAVNKFSCMKLHVDYTQLHS